jgi:tetratricopeptide (TPR) repeat protein
MGIMKFLKRTVIMLAIFFNIVIPYTAAFADLSIIEELENRYKQAPLKEKVKILLQLSDLYKTRSREKLLEYAQKSLALARRINDKKLEAESLRQIGFQYYAVKEDYEKALEFLGQCLQLYRKQADKKGIALTLNNIGIVYYHMNKVQEALDCQLKSLELKKEFGDIKEINSSLNNIGLIYWHSGNFNEALKFFLRAVKNYEKSGERENLSRVLLNMGLVYMDWAEYDLALEYFYKALDIMEKIDDKRAIAVCANNIGNVYKNIGRLEEALTFSLRALELSREIGYKFGEGNALNSIGVIYQVKKELDKASDFFKLSIRIKEEIDNKKGIANTLTNMGNIALEQGKLQQALEYFKHSLKKHEIIDNKMGIVNLSTNIGNVYLKFHQYNNGFKYAARSLKLAEELKAKEMIENCYALYSDLYEATGNHKKALEFYKLYMEIKHRIFTAESDEKISRLQTNYKSLQKDKEIEILKKNNKIQELVMNRQKIVRNVAVVIAFLLLIIFLQFYRQYRYLFSFWKRKNYIAHYRLVDKIGSGGMGDIYKARDIRKKTRKSLCAVKVLKEEYFKDEKYKTRFKNEAALIDQINHPNIVKVMERGEHHDTLYIAMELLEGETLADLLEKEKQISLNTALTMMIQMAGALAAIHKQGIIHRDLKPENIMVTQAGNNFPLLKILDFGLARTQNLTRLTRTGMIMGTIFYIAPEQLIRSTILPAGDIYSLGVLCYQVLTGEMPFTGDTAFGIARQILNKEPITIETLQPDVPVELGELVKKMMDRTPGKRPSAIEVLNQLKEIEKSIEQ